MDRILLYTGAGRMPGPGRTCGSQQYGGREPGDDKLAGEKPP